MKLAICDDEKEIRSYIADVARENFPELTIEEYEKADGRMADLEGVLGEDFLRVHRAYIVNMRFVKEYDWKTIKVGGTDIPVARGKYRELVKAYMSYHTRMERM